MAGYVPLPSMNRFRPETRRKERVSGFASNVVISSKGLGGARSRGGYAPLPSVRSQGGHDAPLPSVQRIEARLADVPVSKFEEPRENETEKTLSLAEEDVLAQERERSVFERTDRVNDLDLMEGERDRHRAGDWIVATGGEDLRRIEARIDVCRSLFAAREIFDLGDLPPESTQRNVDRGRSRGVANDDASLTKTGVGRVIEKRADRG